MVKLLKVATHVLEDILHRDVHLLHDALVDVSDDLLNHLELLEQFSSSLEDVL